MDSDALYFVAILPPKTLSEEIQRIRYEFRDRFDSRHALKSPPHITLLSPFRSHSEAEKEIVKSLAEVTDSMYPFRIRLNNYASFPPRVIFIDVKRSNELGRIQEMLENKARIQSHVFNYNYDRRPFHPHLTIAFKDLSLENFQRSWDEFKNKVFEAEFMADRLTLLKHTGEIWQPVADIRLTK